MKIQSAVKGASKGDKKALKFLYNRYKKNVMCLCTYFLRSQESANEAFILSFSEIFKEIVGKPATNEKLFEQIVYSKTVQVTKSIIQKNRPDAFRDAGKADFSGIEVSPDIDFNNLTENDKKSILNAVRGLQTRQCYVYTMNSAFGLQRHQLANALKLDPEKIESSLNRAKDNIKKCFFGEEQGGKKDILSVSSAMKSIFSERIEKTEIPKDCDEQVFFEIKNFSKLMKIRIVKIVGFSLLAALLIVGGIFAVIAIKNNSASVTSSNEITEENTDTDIDSASLGEENALTGKHHAEIVVKGYGTISLELDGDTAPISVGNFVKLAKDGFYNGLTFHRIMTGFMIQGGDPKGDGTGGSGNSIKGEFSANGVENNISHVRGTLSMARSSDYDSGDSQFFIMQADNTSLDGNYAGFGKVTSGMEIVDKICEDTQVTDNNGTVESANQPIITSITVID